MSVPPGNRYAVLRDLRRDLVAHDRQWVALRGGHERSRLQRRKYLFPCFLGGPAVTTAVVGDGLASVDALDQLGSHVLVLEAECVARLVAHYAQELGLRRAHGEAFEIHRRQIRFNA